MPLFTIEGLAFLARWGHFFAGITWIGLLYYFNFVQVPSFAQMEAGSRIDAIRHLVPRALWWFRWMALTTWLTGVTILGIGWRDYNANLMEVSILTGAMLGTIMLANVWFVIWPNQNVVIASAEATATGGQANPAAAAAGRKALIASRTNVVFSIPLLFFMGATHHLVPGVVAHFVAGDSSQVTVYWLFVAVVAGVLEANALGLFGGVGPGVLRKPLENVRDVLISGFVLAAVIYGVGWELILRPM